MPKLRNPKIEAFAQNLARGMKQGRAYVQAGYSANKAGASRMAKAPEVVDRVEEIKAELSTYITAVAKIEDPEDIYETVAELGLTMGWIGAQYKIIYEESVKNGSYASANQAVANLQKLMEAEQHQNDKGDESREDYIKVSDTLKMLEAMGDIAKSVQGPRVIQEDGTPLSDADDFLLALPDLPDFEEDDQ